MSEQVKKVSEEHLSKLQELNQNFANPNYTKNLPIKKWLEDFFKIFDHVFGKNSF